ncbi:EME1 [Candida oxycetoniae]|uniref:EME1 n=1 Tax=Candida oxycetoniae TaxID=497107 RepID=A0AAI9STS0_9ASCO|nr:EME1 [Candida oxycetoniae]KAI3402907.2 EME1 [Candida oxycetoniae]
MDARSKLSPRMSMVMRGVNSELDSGMSQSPNSLIFTKHKRILINQPPSSPPPPPPPLNLNGSRKSRHQQIVAADPNHTLQSDSNNCSSHQKEDILPALSSSSSSGQPQVQVTETTSIDNVFPPARSTPQRCSVYTSASSSSIQAADATTTTTTAPFETASEIIQLSIESNINVQHQSTPSTNTQALFVHSSYLQSGYSTATSANTTAYHRHLINEELSDSSQIVVINPGQEYQDANSTTIISNTSILPQILTTHENKNNALPYKFESNSTTQVIETNKVYTTNTLPTQHVASPSNSAYHAATGTSSPSPLKPPISDNHSTHPLKAQRQQVHLPHQEVSFQFTSNTIDAPQKKLTNTTCTAMSVQNGINANKNSSLNATSKNVSDLDPGSEPRSFGKKNKEDECLEKSILGKEEYLLNEVEEVNKDDNLKQESQNLTSINCSLDATQLDNHHPSNMQIVSSRLYKSEKAYQRKELTTPIKTYIEIFDSSDDDGNDNERKEKEGEQPLKVSIESPIIIIDSDDDSDEKGKESLEKTSQKPREKVLPISSPVITDSNSISSLTHQKPIAIDPSSPSPSPSPSPSTTKTNAIASLLEASKSNLISKNYQSDSIVDSSFSFSNILDTNAAIASSSKPKNSKPLPTMPSFVQWLSSDEENDSEIFETRKLDENIDMAKKRSFETIQTKKTSQLLSNFSNLKEKSHSFSTSRLISHFERQPFELQQEQTNSKTSQTVSSKIAATLDTCRPQSVNVSGPLKGVENPIKRVRDVQHADSAPKNKKVKRSKTVTSLADLPQIDNFRYSIKELQEANKVNRKKEELYAEMEIWAGSKLFGLFQEYQEDLKSPINEISIDLPIIFWKRNVKAEYIKEKDYFIPCPPRKVLQRTFVLYYSAHDLITFLLSNTLKNEITASLQHLKERTTDKHHIIVMVEGYDQLINKIKAHRQRQFRSQVLYGPNVDEQKKKKKNQKKKSADNEQQQIAQYPEPQEIEKMINHAQLDLKVNIFTVRSRQESINWLNSFTYTISLSLYDKYERNEHLANLGNVRSGSDTKNTFLQSIQHFTRMTSSKAELLHDTHKSMYSLYCKFRTNGTLGKDVLGRNMVPPTVDSAMLNFFTSDDPNKVIT